MQPSMFEVSFLIHNGLFIQSITNEKKIYVFKQKSHYVLNPLFLVMQKVVQSQEECKQQPCGESLIEPKKILFNIIK